MLKLTRFISPIFVVITAVLILSAPGMAKAAAVVGPNYVSIKNLSQKSFTADGKIVYGAQKASGSWHIVVQDSSGGTEAGPYLNVSSAIVSPDSAKYAFNILASDNKWYVSIKTFGDSNVLSYGPYESIGDIFFSDNSQYISFSAVKADGINYLTVINLADNTAATIDSGGAYISLFAFSFPKISYKKSGIFYTKSAVDGSIFFQYNGGYDPISISPDYNFYIFKNYSNGLDSIYLQRYDSQLNLVGNYANLVYDKVLFSPTMNLFSYAAQKYNSGSDVPFFGNAVASNGGAEEITTNPYSLSYVYPLGFNSSGTKVAYSFYASGISWAVLVKDLLTGNNKFYKLTYINTVPFVTTSAVSRDFLKIAYVKEKSNTSDYSVVLEDLNNEYVAPRCGDGNVDSGEFCDGANLNGQNCPTRGFSGGTLSCSADCKSFVTSACVSSVCGNGRIDSGEVCDSHSSSGDMNNQTCPTKGFSYGTLRCSTDCKSFNTSGCVGTASAASQQVTPTCVDSDSNITFGNNNTSFIKGSISGNYMDGSTYVKYDECVGSNQLKEWSCGIMPVMFNQQKVVFTIPNSDGSVTTQASDLVTPQIDNKNYLVSSSITCTNGCVDGACKQSATGTCGNGQIDFGEVCDSANLNGQTCQSKNYASGALLCATNCLSFNTSGCIAKSSVNENFLTSNLNENRLIPAKMVNGILYLNRLISSLEQDVINLETGLTTTINKALTNRLKGYLIIQPEANGEVWYTSPDTGERFFMADREATYGILSGMGNGIKASDLAKVPIGYDPNIYPTTGDGALVDTDQDGLTDILEQAIGTDPNNPDTDGDGFNDFAEVMGGYNPNGPGKMPIDMIFTKKLKGIYLDVENSNARGAAWYINPKDFKRYYVSPETAYNVMKSLSLGVSNNNLRQIPVGEFGELSQ